MNFPLSLAPLPRYIALLVTSQIVVHYYTIKSIKVLAITYLKRTAIWIYLHFQGAAFKLKYLKILPQWQFILKQNIHQYNTLSNYFNLHSLLSDLYRNFINCAILNFHKPFRAFFFMNFKTQLFKWIQISFNM